MVDADGPLVLVLALVVDAALGEPPNRLHPIVWMLAKTGAYRLGDAIRPVDAGTIAEAWRTTRLAGTIAAGCALAATAWGSA